MFKTHLQPSIHLLLLLSRVNSSLCVCLTQSASHMCITYYLVTRDEPQENRHSKEEEDENEDRGGRQIRRTRAARNSFSCTTRTAGATTTSYADAAASASALVKSNS